MLGLLSKERIIEILEKNEQDIANNEWENVYESIGELDRSDFSIFLAKNDIDLNILFRNYVPSYAFERVKSITQFHLQKSVTIIGNSAFCLCTNLHSIDIPDSVVTIEPHCFDHCESLTSIRIPKGVTEISDWGFNCCSNLATINIPESITYIGKYSFNQCESLTSIDIPKSLRIIGPGCFTDCCKLSNIDLSSISNIGRLAFSRTAITTADLRNLTSIEEFCFNGCKDLEIVKLSNKLKHLKKECFARCGDITIEFYGSKEEWEHLMKVCSSSWNIKTNIKVKFKK